MTQSEVDQLSERQQLAVLNDATSNDSWDKAKEIAVFSRSTKVQLQAIEKGLSYYVRGNTHLAYEAMKVLARGNFYRPGRLPKTVLRWLLLGQSDM